MFIREYLSHSVNSFPLSSLICFAFLQKHFEFFAFFLGDPEGKGCGGGEGGNGEGGGGWWCRFCLDPCVYSM